MLVASHFGLFDTSFNFSNFVFYLKSHIDAQGQYVKSVQILIHFDSEFVFQS